MSLLQSFVALITVVIRQYYFLQHFEEVIKRDRKERRHNRQPILSNLPDMRKIAEKVARVPRERNNTPSETEQVSDLADGETTTNATNTGLENGDRLYTRESQEGAQSIPTIESIRDDHSNAPDSTRVRFVEPLTSPANATGQSSAIKEDNQNSIRRRYAFVHNGSSAGGHWQPGEWLVGLSGNGI